jgi:hypothetical protein
MPPDVIEVKRQFNRTAMGQIIAGHDVCEQQYSVTPARLIIVCAVGDAALAWVCQKRRIIVSQLSQHSYRHTHDADLSCEASIQPLAHA